MSRRLLGSFSPENLARVLNFFPHSEQSLIQVRGGRPGLTKGPPPQHYFTNMRALLAKLINSDSTTMEESKQTAKGQADSAKC